jgi:hypothetical protein
MTEKDELSALFEEFKRRLEKAKPNKRAAAIEKAIASLKTWLKGLQPTQKEIKENLLTDETAIKIRSIYSSNKGLFDLKDIARQLGLTLQRPNIDHIIIGYYHPHNHLNDLLRNFEKAAQQDPTAPRLRKFQEWRGQLRSLKSVEDVIREVERIVEKEGIDTVRGFAEHLNARDFERGKKLAKNAPVPKVVQAVASHLWSEKMRSKAQEGS